MLTLCLGGKCKSNGFFQPSLKQTIDSYHQRFIKRFDDLDFNKGMTVKIVQHLSEAKIEELSDYIDRKGNIHKGKAFVKLCNNVILDKISNSS